MELFFGISAIMLIILISTMFIVQYHQHHLVVQKLINKLMSRNYSEYANYELAKQKNKGPKEKHKKEYINL